MKIIIDRTEDRLPQKCPVEIVERKGLGHPDTLCDIAADEASISLSKMYLEKCGTILHHNLDKCLLVGGKSRVSFGGGKIVTPLEFVISGRATNKFKGSMLPVEEVVVESIKNSFSSRLRHLDVGRDLRIITKIGTGSVDLTQLFISKYRSEIPLANDTSIGTGYYPLNKCERLTKLIENFLNSTEIKAEYPYIGEDIKVMTSRIRDKYIITIAVAIIDRYVLDLNDYCLKIKKIENIIRTQTWFNNNSILHINTADDIDKGRIYLTVTGTSAENGDDGEVGRGNRSNGLITPYRPMTMEAVAGKNPVSHVGKIYNIFANELSRKLVNMKYCSDSYVIIVSQIGKPITSPQVMELRLWNQMVSDDIVRNTAKDMLSKIPSMWKRVIDYEFKLL